MKNEMKSKNIPEGWKIERLEEVSEIYLSNVDKKIFKDEYPVFLCNYMDVYNNNYISKQISFMKATASQNEIEKFSLKKGDVIITKDSETKEDIAQSCVVVEEFTNVLCGYHLALIRPNQEKINSIFLSKLFQNGHVKTYLISRANGITRFGLNQPTITKVPIPIPPLREQQKIASILTTIDESIEETGRVISACERIKKGLMQELLTKGIPGKHKKFKKTELGEIPEDWSVTLFGELMDVKSGLGFKYSEYTDSGVRLLKIDNVSHEEIIWENTSYLPKEYLETYPDLVLKERDILLALNRPITQERLKIGILGIQDVPSILYQRVGKIIIKNNIEHVFAYYILLHQLIPFIQRHSVGSDQPFINLTQLKKMKLPLPSKEEQEDIATILFTMDKKIKINKSKKDSLLNLKKSLMQKLLTGKIRVKAN